MSKSKEGVVVLPKEFLVGLLVPDLVPAEAVPDSRRCTTFFQLDRVPHEYVCSTGNSVPRFDQPRVQLVFPSG